MSPDRQILGGAWPVRRVEELAVAIQYGYTAKAKTDVHGPKYLRITDIQDDAVDWSQVPSCEIDEEEIAKYQLQRGDLVFARTGATVGKSYLIRSAPPASVFASYLIRIRLRDEVDPRYVAYFFRSPSYWRQISERQAGIGQPNVNGKKLAQVQLPVAPIEEQRRIVAEIEKQFSRLDEAIANLKRAKANLKRYKAAVLKAAVEGSLVSTEAELARREGRRYETGAQLLQRILEAGRSQWKRTGKYKEFAPLDTSELPDLPEGWAWACCDHVFASIEAGTSFKCAERPPLQGETGVLKVSAVTWGVFDENESKTCVTSSRIEESYLVQEGDFLFSRANTIELVGACVIVGAVNKRLMLSDKTLRFRLVPQLLPAWLLTCLRSRFGRHEIERLATGNQESMRNIGQERIRRIRIPIPPDTEQHRIVAELDRLLSLVREVDAEVDTNLRRAERLRQATLQEAFAGASSAR